MAGVEGAPAGGEERGACRGMREEGCQAARRRFTLTNPRLARLSSVRPERLTGLLLFPPVLRRFGPAVASSFHRRRRDVAPPSSPAPGAGRSVVDVTLAVGKQERNASLSFSLFASAREQLAASAAAAADSRPKGEEEG